MTSIEIHAKKNAEGEIEMIRTATAEGELILELSLYRITLNHGIFYLVSSCETEGGKECAAAECLGDDFAFAEELYRKLVEGSVPPYTLHEIVNDRFETHRYSGCR